MVGEATAQTLVGIQKAIDVAFISCNDDDQVRIFFGHSGEEAFNGPVAEVLAIFGGVAQGVGFVNEKHIAF